MLTALLPSPRWSGSLKRGASAPALLALVALVLAAGWSWLARAATLRVALLGGGVAAGATALGAALVFLTGRLSARTQAALFGFGAGVMLAASAFSLLLPGLAAAAEAGASRWGAGLIVGSATLLGGAGLLLADRLVPHAHTLEGRAASADRRLRSTWLFVAAIALHNVPEGLAIGVSAAGTDAVGASALATGIALQDIPEGMVVALALMSVGYGRWRAAWVGAASGLVEPLGAAVGAAAVGVSTALLPWGMGFAAGAMLFVVLHEVVPEAHRGGHERVATSSLLGGFVLMMLLDTALG